MADKLTTDLVWDELYKQIFGVLGMVTAKHEARTVGVVYAVHQRLIYIATNNETWKTRHISQNPHVSLTVPIHKSIPLIPWFKIPAATITFSGTAAVKKPADVSDEILSKLFHGLESKPDVMADAVIFEIEPVGDFVTYGVGVSLMTMRDTKKARGRVPVA